ncbi:MAG: phosphohydrolase [Burkholderiales bacterium]
MSDTVNDPTRSPLLRPDWHYIEKTALEDFSAQDWTVMNRQRADYQAADQARQVLRMLAAQEHDATFGYMVNNYRHSLQSATMCLRDGLDDETIVVALLHDVGFIACPASHGPFAAELLGPYVSDKHYWMLQRHAIFQDIHAPTFPGVDVNARERWRGHPNFEWAAEFVAKYDQDAADPRYDCAPLAHFEPIVQRFFARPAKRRAIE